MFKRKKNSIVNQSSRDLQKRGDIKTAQYNDNSDHLSNLEFAKDFEDCCNVEFGRDFENRSSFINDQFGEENIRKNNYGNPRDYISKDGDYNAK